MSRMPVLPDKPPLLADANARFRPTKLTPLRVFAFTFVVASLCLWIGSQPWVQEFAKAFGEKVKARYEASQESR